jgi:hypothetical protein
MEDTLIIELQPTPVVELTIQYTEHQVEETVLLTVESTPSEEILLSIENGRPGKNGLNGLSAYQIWQQNGNGGSVTDFLNSLKGTDGREIEIRKTSTALEYHYKGDSNWQLLILLSDLEGASAYEIAVANGFVGTEQQWLDSLRASSGYNSLILTAAENISALKIVRSANGQAALHNLTSTNEPIGMSVTAALTGDPVTVATSGVIIDDNWTIVPGTRYYAQPNGAISSTPATTGKSQLIGVGLQNNSLLLNIQQAIYFEEDSLLQFPSGIWGNDLIWNNDLIYG